jgi:flavodoxin
MIVYSTVGGTTRKVAERISLRTSDLALFSAHDALAMTPPSTLKHIVLFCPTYGDGELEDEFERFLFGWNWSLIADSKFAVCELGVYTGYEEFGHGLLPIIYGVLESYGLSPFAEPLSIDAVPIRDWDMIDRWADTIIRAIEAGS